MNDLIQAVLGFTLLIVGVFTLIYPWRFQSKAARILVHLPLLLIPLDFAYEAAIPVETNIRIDLLFFWPLFGLAAICYCLKLVLLARASRRKDPAT